MPINSLTWVHFGDLHMEGASEQNHTYPSDLKAGSQRLIALFKRYGVRCVDMGHTHYNELANDGQTIYMATRSTGQIEEGPVGFAVVNIQRDVVSWRFKPLRSAWPLVMVTAPADKRLMTAAARRERASASFLQITARAWSAAGIRACRCRIDQGEWLAMTPVQDTSRWALPQPLEIAPRRIIVEAEDNDGQVGEDHVELDPARPAGAPVGVGSDADSIGAWPENHVLGTQLGLNRNGRHW